LPIGRSEPGGQGNDTLSKLCVYNGDRSLIKSAFFIGERRVKASVTSLKTGNVLLVTKVFAMGVCVLPQCTIILVSFCCK